MNKYENAMLPDGFYDEVTASLNGLSPMALMGAGLAFAAWGERMRLQNEWRRRVVDWL